MRDPVYVGGLLELPLQSGRIALVDPKSITSVTEHRFYPDQTVVRCGRDDIHFVSVDIGTLRRWLDDSAKKGSKQKGGS